MLNREQCHKLLDAVLDIVEGGEGDDGYPYVNLEISNYGTRHEVRIIDNGFGSRKKDYDADYIFRKRSHQNEYGLYQSCMEHLQRLKKQIRREEEC